MCWAGGNGHKPLTLAPGDNYGLVLDVKKQQLTMQPASYTQAGTVTTGVQTFKGPKTFKGTTTDNSSYALVATNFNDEPIAEFRNDKVSLFYNKVLVGSTTVSTFTLDVTGTGIYRLAGSAFFEITSDGQLRTRFNGGSGSGTGSVRINSGSPHFNNTIGMGTSINPAVIANSSAVAIGPGAQTGNASTALGVNAIAGHFGTAIGDGATNGGFAYSIALGRSSINTANSQFVCGYYPRSGSVGPILDVYFGSGVQRNGVAGAGVSYTINGSGAFGTNEAGGSLILAGGKPTGSGTAGDLIFATSAAGANGTDLRALTNRWWIKGTTGQLANVNTPNASAIVQFDSTTRGFAPPRMLGSQAEAIATPLESLLVYATDGSGSVITSKGWWGFDGSTWVKLN